jgi:hypothetical protein
MVKANIGSFSYTDMKFTSIGIPFLNIAAELRGNASLAALKAK